MLLYFSKNSIMKNTLLTMDIVIIAARNSRGFLCNFLGNTRTPWLSQWSCYFFDFSRKITCIILPLPEKYDGRFLSSPVEHYRIRCEIKKSAEWDLHECNRRRYDGKPICFTKGVIMLLYRRFRIR